MDIDGMLREKVASYMKKHPNADFYETKLNCFPNKNDNLTGVLSPRIFEAALTKTCQILVGEDYYGIMIPNEDYIVVNNDFSNLDSVLEKLKDKEYCEKIANNCYRYLIESNNYSYEKFAEFIYTHYPNKELSKIIEKNCEQNNYQVHREMEEFDIMLKRKGLR